MIPSLGGLRDGRGPGRHRIRMSVWGLVLAVTVACGEGSGGALDTTAEPAAPPPTLGELRTIHARALAAGPLLSDLEGETRRVAELCLEESDAPACRAGETTLAPERWVLVQEVLAARGGWATDEVEREALCRMNDLDPFINAFPGRHAFLEQVASPPPPPTGPVDALVVIGTGSAGVTRARRLLEEGLADEALKVQVPSHSTPSGFHPEPGAQGIPPGFFAGYYAPAIEERMAAPRPDCLRFRSNAAVQGACRRDLAVSIAREWLRDRGHKSVRIILDQQMTWPEIDLLFRRMVPDVEVTFDPEFEVRLSRSSTFITEMCGIVATEELWQDYRFFVRTLFADPTPG